MILFFILVFFTTNVSSIVVNSIEDLMNNPMPNTIYEINSSIDIVEAVSLLVDLSANVTLRCNTNICFDVDDEALNFSITGFYLSFSTLADTFIRVADESTATKLILQDLQFLNPAPRVTLVQLQSRIASITIKNCQNATSTLALISMGSLINFRPNAALVDSLLVEDAHFDLQDVNDCIKARVANDDLSFTPTMAFINVRIRCKRYVEFI